MSSGCEQPLIKWQLSIFCAAVRHAVSRISAFDRRKKGYFRVGGSCHIFSFPLFDHSARLIELLFVRRRRWKDNSSLWSVSAVCLRLVISLKVLERKYTKFDFFAFPYLLRCCSKHIQKIRVSVKLCLSTSTTCWHDLGVIFLPLLLLFGVLLCGEKWTNIRSTRFSRIYSSSYLGLFLFFVSSIAFCGESRHVNRFCGKKRHFTTFSFP